MVELPLATEVQDKDLVLQEMNEMLKIATGHEEVLEKDLVLQDMKEMLKMATGHEEDAG